MALVGPNKQMTSVSPMDSNFTAHTGGIFPISMETKTAQSKQTANLRTTLNIVDFLLFGKLVLTFDFHFPKTFLY